jgi:hypothetical protein
MMQAGNPASMMQIGEVAKRSSLSVDAIRFYEHRALLPKAPRTLGWYRFYSGGDVVRLRFITDMQGLGFAMQSWPKQTASWMRRMPPRSRRTVHANFPAKLSCAVTRMVLNTLIQRFSRRCSQRF